jgi:hypothetical protein
MSDVLAPSVATSEVPDSFWWLQEATAGAARFAAACAVATGRGVTVGIVDRGINHAHTDLLANHDTSRDYAPPTPRALRMPPPTARRTGMERRSRA